MADSKNHVYSIDLDIKSSQASKQALKQLQTAFNDSNKSIDELNKTYLEMSKYVEDTTELERQYNKVIAQRLSDKDKEIDKLKAEAIAIAANRDLTEEQKKQQLAIKKAEIKRLEDEKKLIKLKEKEVKVEKSLGQLIKSDLNLMKEKIKAQFKFIESLKTTEGRYNAIKKAASAAAKASVGIGKTVAKAGVKVAGGAAAMGLGLLGAAAGAAQGAADKENALKSLKSGIDPALANKVYIKSGADFPSIVAALNNLSAVTKDGDLLVQGAVLELQNPGIGQMLLSQKTMDSKGISKLQNAIDQIKKQTGTQDLTGAIEASMKSGLVTSGVVSQTEFLQAYSALAQRGLDEETIGKILSTASKQGGNFIENLNKLNLASFVSDAQMRTRLGHDPLGLQQLDLEKGSGKSQAQSVAEKLREFELRKDEMLMKILPIVEKVLPIIETVFEALEPHIKDITDLVSDLIELVTPLIKPVLKVAKTVLDVIKSILTPIIKAFQWLASKFNNDDLEEVKLSDGTIHYRKKGSGALDIVQQGASGGSRAQGGLVTSPALVGEAGPELVIPMDYSRAGRTSQIINNFNTNQNFNMAASERTPLALASAVGRNRFVNRTAH